MNWHLLAILAVSYTAVFFALSYGVSFISRGGLRRRFEQEFHRPANDYAVEALSPEERERWDYIVETWQSPPAIRRIELIGILFHYPAIIVHVALGLIQPGKTLNPFLTYLADGAAYVGIFYLILR
jgi:hypothetical protein